MKIDFKAKHNPVWLHLDSFFPCEQSADELIPSTLLAQELKRWFDDYLCCEQRESRFDLWTFIVDRLSNAK